MPVFSANFLRMYDTLPPTLSPNRQVSQSSRSMIGALDVCYSYIKSREMLTIVEVSSLYDVGKFLQEFGGCG